VCFACFLCIFRSVFSYLFYTIVLVLFSSVSFQSNCKAAIFSVNAIYHCSRYPFLHRSSIWCFKRISFTNLSHYRPLPTKIWPILASFRFQSNIESALKKSVKKFLTAYSPLTWTRFVEMGRRPRSESRNIIKED